MIITCQSPARISLAGGGSDIAEFSDKFGGACINFSINIYQHVTLYTDDDIWQHPINTFPLDAKPSYCYKILDILKLGGMHQPLRLKTEFDGVIGAGLGSSGAFTVALLAAINKWQGNFNDKLFLAGYAYEMEVNQCKRAGGKQDHFAATHGGLNLFLFGKQDKVITLPRQWIENLSPYMCLFYLGSPRQSHDIQKGFSELTDRQIETLKKIKETTKTALDFFRKNDIVGLSELLQYSWELKKKSNNVSSDKIDEIYDYGLKNGGIAGKILGSGGGGYMLFLVPPNKRMKLVDAMRTKGIEEIDFSFTPQGVDVRRL